MAKITIPHPERKRALILVDIQEGFLNEKNRWIIPNIQEVIREGEYDLVVEAVFHADEGSLWQRQTGWTLLLQPTVPEIKDMLPARTIGVVKTASSAFKGSKDFAGILKENGIEEVHIVGLDTYDCVFATAKESFDPGFFTYVLEECTEASDGKEYRDAALKILRHLEMTNNSVHEKI